MQYSYKLKYAVCAVICSVLVMGTGFPSDASSAEDTSPAGTERSFAENETSFAGSGGGGAVQRKPAAKAKPLSKQEKRERSLKNISKKAYKYWKNFEKAAGKKSSRRAINIQLKIETHQKINAKGFPTGNGGAGWSGKKQGKYHHAFVATGRRYFGAFCMLPVHFDMVSITKIQKLAKKDKKLAWMAYAAEAQQYLETKYRTWGNAVANGGGW
jgi:hypothetical protein